MADDAERFQMLFLAELSALDAFSAAREDRGSLPLGREDPDIRRLLEALAFFSARTRSIAQREMSASVRRMADALLPDFVLAMPARGLLQLVPDERFVEPLDLPRGTALRTFAAEGTIAAFSTERRLRVLPLSVESATLVQDRAGLAIEIVLASRVPIRIAETIDLHVRRLGDYRASLTLLDAIRQHFLRASVTYGPAEPDANARKFDCPVRFGPRPPSIEDDELDESPLGKVRAFFQAPERELFLGLGLPAPRSPWRKALVRLELGEDFPEELGVIGDNFLPFVVPIVNRWAAMASPFLHDGTRAEFPIEPVLSGLEAVRLDAVRAVYETGEKGLSLILPASMGGSGWEVSGIEAGAPTLRLHLPEAFDKPRKIVVDALWSQPSSFSTSRGKLKPSFFERHLPGVGLRMLGDMRASVSSPLSEQPAAMLDVLAKRSRPVTTTEDLRRLLVLLGASGTSPLRDMPAQIARLSAYDAPDTSRPSGGLKHVYSVALASRSAEDGPLLRAFGEHIGAVLDAWSEDAVEVEIVTALDVTAALPEASG